MSGLFALGVSLAIAPLSAEARIAPTLRGRVVDAQTGRPMTNDWRGEGLVLARDGRTGRIHAWTSDGTPLPGVVPPGGGWTRLGAHRGYALPLAVREGRLHHTTGLVTPPWRPAEGQATTASWVTGPGLAVPRALIGTETFVLALEPDGQGVQVSVFQELEALARGQAVALLADRRYDTTELLPGGVGRIECLTTGPGDRTVLLIGRTPAGAGLVRWPVVLGVFDRVPQWLSLPWLLTEVTACAATGHDPAQFGSGFVYLIREDGPMLRLTLRQWRLGDGPPETLQPAGVPARVTGLAVARLRRHVEAVYAVAGDEAVYRFSVDGVADQRIEWSLPGGSPRSAP